MAIAETTIRGQEGELWERWLLQYPRMNPMIDITAAVRL